MIITEDFIVINNPKTGSTFVRTVLKEIYNKRTENNNIKEFIFPNIRMPNREPDQHGTVSQIPQIEISKPIVSVVRNPYTRFLSKYFYKWWVKYPPIRQDRLMDIFPNFPNLSIDEFAKLNQFVTQKRLKNICNNIKLKTHIGDQTIQFIQMFSYEPEKVLKKLSENYVLSGAFMEDMPKVNFLKQENLKFELTEFLKGYNFSRTELEIITHTKEINVSDKSSLKNKEELTQKAKTYISESEKILFLIYNVLGIKYSLENI